MTSRTFFAFLTGLHLSILQFCFFFLLLINITSTYVTYGLVVISWMTGSLIGLMSSRPGPIATLALGVAGYYAVYALVLGDPLAPYTFPLSALGVAITALWAGRFFVVMVSRYERVDRLFLDENNGFLVGVVGVFVGFTLLGQPFLLWAPLLSGVGLLAQMRRYAAPR